jgi:uncharacterized membrane protein YphA (DoxX/SURF4 family)
MDIRDIYLRREPGPFCRSAAALVLRLGLGLILFVFGLQKYDQIRAGNAEGVTEEQRAALYPHWLHKSFEGNRFEGSLLNPKAVELFGRALPYAEMGLGVLLVVGLFTGVAATLAGLLLVGLLFGRCVMALNDPTITAQIPGMLSYVLVAVGIIWLAPVTSNFFSLDGLLFGWFWRRNSEPGEFRPQR